MLLLDPPEEIQEFLLWKESLGEYPDEFLHHLDYISTDLDSVESLRHLPNYLEDNTYFLSVPPERYENAIHQSQRSRTP